MTLFTIISIIVLYQVEKSGDIMASRKLSERQELKVQSEREMEVYKRNDMIQRGRHELSLKEQKCVLYAISKIKPDDSLFQEYTFELSDFYRLCGLKKESYTELKAILIGLKQKTWWIETAPNTESTVSWFNKVRTSEKSGIVTVRFDDDMMPYLLELSKQGTFYTHYQLKYVLAMKSQYAIRLYELLKSYQRNNYEWFFEVEELKKQLDCGNYARFPDFRRWVLEPAIKEINEFTDIKIYWEPTKEGKKVTRVTFYMVRKEGEALLDANRAISEALDGHETNPIELLMAESQNTARTQFWRENNQKKKV